MNRPYEQYPEVDAMSVHLRVLALSRTCLEALQKGRTTDEMRAVIDEAVEAEQFELAQAASRALRDFAAAPQLRLL